MESYDLRLVLENLQERVDKGEASDEDRQLGEYVKRIQPTVAGDGICPSNAKDVAASVKEPQLLEELLRRIGAARKDAQDQFDAAWTKVETDGGDELLAVADRAAKDLGVPVDALYYHGVPLDLAKPLKAQGVFRDPVLLEWK